MNIDIKSEYNIGDTLYRMLFNGIARCEIVGCELTTLLLGEKSNPRVLYFHIANKMEDYGDESCKTTIYSNLEKVTPEEIKNVYFKTTEELIDFITKK